MYLKYQLCLLICVVELILRDVAREEGVVSGAAVSTELDPRVTLLRFVVVAVHREKVGVLLLPERSGVIL